MSVKKCLIWLGKPFGSLYCISDKFRTLLMPRSPSPHNQQCFNTYDRNSNFRLTLGFVKPLWIMIRGNFFWAHRPLDVARIQNLFFCQCCLLSWSWDNCWKFTPHDVFLKMFCDEIRWHFVLSRNYNKINSKGVSNIMGINSKIRRLWSKKLKGSKYSSLVGSR